MHEDFVILLRKAFDRYIILRDTMFGSEEYKQAAMDLLAILKTNHLLDTFIALYQNGPLDAGDLPSKKERDILMQCGLCVPVISKGLWKYALSGILDSFWNFVVEDLDSLHMKNVEIIKEHAELLKEQYNIGGLTFSLVSFPVGHSIPEDLKISLIDYNLFMDLLANSRKNNQPIWHLNKIVVIYHDVPKPNMPYYFADTLKQLSVPEILRFVASQIFQWEDNSFSCIKLPHRTKNGKITQEQMLQICDSISQFYL